MGYGRGYDIGIFGSVFGHNVTQNLPVLGIQSMQPPRNFDAVFNLSQGPPPRSRNHPEPAADGSQRTPDAAERRDRVHPSEEAAPADQRRLEPVDPASVAEDLAVEAAYIGNKGTHVFAGSAATTISTRPPRLRHADDQPAEAVFQKFGWSQNFRYYGRRRQQLSCSSRPKRFSRGYSLMSHYTWSRAFNYTNTYYNIDRELAYGRTTITAVTSSISVASGSCRSATAAPTCSDAGECWTPSSADGR